MFPSILSTYVIAEAGSCHDGQFDQARRLVDAAVEAGCSAVKFQFWSDADRLADRRRVPDVYRVIYARYRMPARWLAWLSALAVDRDLDFLCTAYLPEDVAVVAPYVRHFKVASFEAEARDLIAAHVPIFDEDEARERQRRLFVSLGMGARPAVAEAALGSRHSGRLWCLHCVSAYSAPLDALNLRRIVADELDGFSDHSDPALMWTGALAVAAGARVLEAHLKLNDTDPTNPDAPHAMVPAQFARYVRWAREAEQALGSGMPGEHEAEREMAQYRVS